MENLTLASEGVRKPRELAIQQQTGLVGRLRRLLLVGWLGWRRWCEQFSQALVTGEGAPPAGAVAAVLRDGFTEENVHDSSLASPFMDQKGRQSK